MQGPQFQLTLTLMGGAAGNALEAAEEAHEAVGDAIEAAEHAHGAAEDALMAAGDALGAGQVCPVALRTPPCMRGGRLPL